TRRLGLGFSVFEPCLEFLKQQRLVEITGGSVFGGASFRYRTTDAGRTWAAGVLKQNQYVGVAPVPLEQYCRYMLDFKKAVPLRADRDSVRAAFSHLVVSDAVLDAVGPAVNFGHSMFVYGAPGNGKTMMAHAIRGPLESRIDFLPLQSGQTIEIPFMVLLVLSTNLKPTELADEAFLRRIRYKIFAESPTRGDFVRIFENYCKTREIPFERPVVEYM